MVRQRIEMKKIENITARQVTFSKRRRGLFKKAFELSTLCDAQIALLVFSSTGKLFDFSSPSIGIGIGIASSSSSSSRMMEAIHRYKKHTGDPGKSDHSSLVGQDSNYVILSKELDEKSQQLRQLRGEELEGLDFEELCKLEREIERGQARVRQIKFDILHQELASLKRKELQLVGENGRLKDKVISVAKEHGSSQILLQDDLGYLQLYVVPVWN